MHICRMLQLDLQSTLLTTTEDNDDDSDDELQLFPL